MNQLASLGQTIERVLSCPVNQECAPAPIFSSVNEFDGPSLWDVVQNFNSDTWTVDRLEGAVYRRNRALLAWNDPDSLPDNLEWQVAIICVMRTKEKQSGINPELPDDYTLKAQLSTLTGEDLGDLLFVFTGRRFTDDEMEAWTVRRCSFCEMDKTDWGMGMDRCDACCMADFPVPIIVEASEMTNKAKILQVGSVDPFRDWHFAGGKSQMVRDNDANEYVMTCGWSLDELRDVALKHGENTRHWPPLGDTDGAIWFVDGEHGDDTLDGLTPGTALQTYDEAYSRTGDGDIIYLGPGNYSEGEP